MAFAASNLTNEPRSFSIGPVKVQILTFTCVSGDTSGTVTADALSGVDAVVVPSLSCSAISYSGNVATLTFADPAANRTGTIICFGR